MNGMNGLEVALVVIATYTMPIALFGFAAYLNRHGRSAWFLFFIFGFLTLCAIRVDVPDSVFTHSGASHDSREHQGIGGTSTGKGDNT